MEQKLKEVVSEYINIPADQISNDTVIDRLSVPSSIVLHRMYARLAENGIKVDNYWNIKTFGNLLQQNNVNIPLSGSSQLVEDSKGDAGSDFAVGIDIEDVKMMPVVNDFRESEFYKMNFASSEISYCILQQNPYVSFAGLFSAKEAIIKSNNAYRNTGFNEIVIEHSKEGKPLFKDFQLSISHTENAAVAIAVRQNKEVAGSKDMEIEPQPEVQIERKSGSNTWLIILGFLISIAALLISFFK